MPDLEIYRPRRASLMRRIAESIRSYTLGPLSLKDPEIRKYFQGSDTSTGISVSEYSAMNYSAVWSAVKLISGDVASQPLVLYRRDGEGKQRYEGHPLYRILHDQPNSEMSSLTFRQTLQAHALTWGNGYAEIERDGAGRPRNLWPLTPDRVHPDRDAGQLVYRVTNNSGPDTTIDPMNMLHIPGLGWDGMQGYGVIAKARESVALGIAAEKFGGKFYGNGSTFGGVITHPAKFATPAARENFEKALRNRSQGVDRAHGLLLMEEGMTYQQMGIPPNEAQFLESRQFQITEIARWFNVPPHKIGDLSRATFSNIEQQNIEYVQTTLVYWFEAWEQELMRKLISPLERNQQFIEHVVEGLLRGDSVGRAALQSAEFNIGALTPNEARALSNRNPVAGGDRPFVPLSMIPMDRVDEYIDSIIQKNTTPKPSPSTPGTGGQREELTAEIRTLADSVSKIHGELAEAHKANAELVDDLTAAKVGQEQLRAEVAAEKGLRRALEEQTEALTEQLAVSASLLKDAEERLEIATKTAEDHVAALTLTKQVVEDRTAERDAATAKAEQWRTLHDAAKDAERAIVTERNELQAATMHLAELLDGAQAALAQEQAERAQENESHMGKVAELTIKVSESTAAFDAQLAALEAQWKETGEKLEAAGAALAERDQDVERITADHDRLKEMWSKDRENLNLLTEQSMADATRAEQAEREKAEADAAHAAAREAEERWRQQYAERVTHALTAQRAVIVDALGRMVRRETEKARRNQATPQKLRAWADAFYSLHKDVCEEALEPAIRVHLALSGSAADAKEVTRAIVREHIATSQQQLRAIVDGEPDEMHQTLERVLTRWETERPGSLGDRLLTEGVAYVRSIR